MSSRKTEYQAMFTDQITESEVVMQRIRAQNSISIAFQNKDKWLDNQKAVLKRLRQTHSPGKQRLEDFLTQHSMYILLKCINDLVLKTFCAFVRSVWITLIRDGTLPVNTTSNHHIHIN